MDLTMELLENTDMNKHAIELIEEKQPPYGRIYAFSSVKLEILKVYIETHLKTRFIRSFKFLIDASIFFDKKPDGSFYLYIDYQSINNLTIKNQYFFLLIGEVLD